MSNMSLDWFKSNLQDRIKEIENLQLKEQQLKEELLCNTFKKSKEKLYKSLILVNDVITVTFLDGEIMSSALATSEHFNKIKDCYDVEEIKKVFYEINNTEDRAKTILHENKFDRIVNNFELLESLSDFTVDNGFVKLSGINRTIPPLLVEKFIEVVDRVKYHKGFGFTPEILNEDEEYVALKRFFMWCCLNPRAEVADELYRFLTENSFRITKQGFFAALRNVVTVHGSPELVHFVSNAYNKVKAVWKKKPNEYTVFLENGEYKLVHEDKLTKTETFTSTTCPECLGDGGWEGDEWDEEIDSYVLVECEHCDGSGEVEEYEYTVTDKVNHGKKIGNLVELYLDLPNREENRFTDDWTKTFDIRIGRVVNMPMNECNWSTQDCAAAGLKYVASF